MPALKNPKHELYARLLSEGKKQKDAYVGAGFKFNAGGASRLAHRADVAQRIEELKGKAFGALVKARDSDNLPTEIPDDAQTLRDLGISLLWVAQQYKDMHERAVEANQFAPAIKAIENLQKMLAAEAGNDDDSPSIDTDRIPVKAMTEMLREIRMIGEGKVVVVDPVDMAEDVTPKEPIGVIKIVDPPEPIMK